MGPVGRVGRGAVRRQREEQISLAIQSSVFDIGWKTPETIRSTFASHGNDTREMSSSSSMLFYVHRDHEDYTGDGRGQGRILVFHTAPVL